MPSSETQEDAFATIFRSMKEDNLEKFISGHRSEFDSENPPPMVWMNLEKELSKEQNKDDNKNIIYELGRTNLMRVMQVAAMFIVVMGVGLMIGVQINKDGNVYHNTNLKEFVEAERHYNYKIDNMWTAVKASEIDDADELAEDLESLDAIYDELKKELLSGNKSNTNEVVNSMIDNYRTKIEILETVLNKTKQQLNLEDDKVEI